MPERKLQEVFNALMWAGVLELDVQYEGMDEKYKGYRVLGVDPFHIPNDMWQEILANYRASHTHDEIRPYADMWPDPKADDL